jgi:hypothetical protein
MGNVASLFDPKVAAEGAALLARKANWEADTRKTGYEGDILKRRLDTLAARPAGMSELAYWAANAAASSTPDSIVAGNTRDGSYNAAMSGDPEKVRLALNYVHGAQPVSVGPGGLLEVNQVTGVPTLSPTPHSNSVIAANNARAAASNASAAAAGSRGSKDPLSQPRVPTTYGDEASELSRMFSYKDDDGNTVNPSEVDVIQKIIDKENEVIKAGLADRTNARDVALAMLGWSKYRRPDEVDESTFPDTTNRFAEPAKVAPVDASAIEADIGKVPEVSLGSIKDPNGPVMKAGHGTHFKIDNTIYMKLVGPDGRSTLQRVQ